MFLKQAEKHRFLKGVVGGLDLTKHEVMKTTIAKFSKETRPKFVGIRHLIDFEPDDFLTRPDVHTGLAILENHGLTFDLQVWTQTYFSAQTPFPELPCHHQAHTPHCWQVSQAQDGD